MFRLELFEQALCVRFPRIRGDVPQLDRTGSGLRRFSPHTRGCSSVSGEFAAALEVFPAYAGMFLFYDLLEGQYDGFPRIRGDVPDVLDGEGSGLLFSPHTRGCSV